MTQTVNFPAGAPIAGPDGRLSPVWLQFFMALFSRTGGTQGASSVDLSIDMPEDSGIEELKAQVFGLRDVVFMLPLAPLTVPSDDQAPSSPPSTPPDDPHGRIEALEALMQRLTTEIEAIRQGQQL